jgi:RND family efflux transporter MFP subunit
MSAPTIIKSQRSNSSRHIRVVAGVLVFALLLLAGVWPRIGRHREAVAIANSAENALPSVVARKAKLAASASELALPGNTEAINIASIYARANGYVRQRLVDIGSVVKAGQVLAVIESPEVDQELAQARANLEHAKAAVEQAGANLEQAKAGVLQARALVEQATANEQLAGTTDQRWTRLVDKGVLPKQSGDERRSAFLARQAESAAARAGFTTAEANVVSRTADLRAADANVQAQGANVRRLERLQSFEQVTAPFEGVVTERKVERGDLVSAGSAGDRNLFTVAQAKTLRIQVNVPQSYAVDLKPGQAAEIIVRERPGQTFTGTVARTAESLNASSRTLLSEVQVDNREGRLLPGMYAQVKFTVARTQNLVVISADSLVVNGQGTRVVVIGPNNRVRYVPVTIGRDLGPEVEILDGLKGGEQVISNPPDTLADGQQVQILTEHPGGGKTQEKKP